VLNRISILFISIAIFGLLQLGGVVSSLSDKALDILFQLRGPIEPSQEIIIIGVDEESLAALGAWPFPRKHHAELLERLTQARVIGFDILFSEPTAQDELLSAAIKSSPPVILATAHNYQHRILYPVSSLSGYFGIGHIEIILSRDGIVREAHAFQHTEQSSLPAFAPALLKGAGINETLSLSGKPILINHYGPEITFLYLSYLDVLQGTIPEVFFKDRFVLIGAEALGIGDSHVTPFSREYPTPGVEIQATILNNLLDNSSLQRLQTVSWILVVGVGLISILIWPSRGGRWNWIINLSFSTILIFCSFVLFRLSLFLNPVPALLFLSLTFGIYLIMERFWTAKKIFNEMLRLDRQLETQLQRVYTNSPTHFFDLQPAPSTTGGIKHHLAHLQAGVKVLSLQHHFIENLLREELLPLILWDRHSGVVTIANSTFNTFWNKHSREPSTLPNLDQFLRLLQKNQPTGENFLLDIGALLDNNTQIPAIDIGLTEHGLKKYFRINMHPFEVDDIRFSGVLAILTDVTEIKELEQLKDKIVSVVSHELKLPLTVIRGYGEMLAETLQDEKKLYIDEICSQTKRLNQLIEDFLDVARIEQNRQEIRRFPLDPIALVKEAEKSVFIPAEKKSIAVISQLPFRASPLIGDYSLLLQAVINLLDNGIKFSPADTQITIKLIEESNRFTLSVSDQGPGVPDESRQEIFDKFNRGQHASTQDGFGLGLSFVKQVVQKHKGELWLEPKTTQGACFCITLPKNSSN
jgi:signal transduction histidine kinase/CHASE2 domain-containing sensor protein